MIVTLSGKKGLMNLVTTTFWAKTVGNNKRKCFSISIDLPSEHMTPSLPIREWK